MSEQRLTLAIIGAHLGMSPAAAQTMLPKVGLTDYQGRTLEDVRLAYIDHLRKMAAGHKSESGEDLVAERVASERVSRQLSIVKLGKELELLISVDEAGELCDLMIGAARTELLSLPQRITEEYRLRHGIELPRDVAEEAVHRVLEQLSRNAPEFAEAQGANDEGVGAAAAAGYYGMGG